MPTNRPQVKALPPEEGIETVVVEHRPDRGPFEVKALPPEEGIETVHAPGLVTGPSLVKALPPEEGIETRPPGWPLPSMCWGEGTAPRRGD